MSSQGTVSTYEMELSTANSSIDVFRLWKNGQSETMATHE